jgi:hypothetical protein
LGVRGVCPTFNKSKHAFPIFAVHKAIRRQNWIILDQTICHMGFQKMWFPQVIIGFNTKMVNFLDDLGDPILGNIHIMSQAPSPPNKTKRQELLSQLAPDTV